MAPGAVSPQRVGALARRSCSSRPRAGGQTFYRGYDVFDPARVGFVSEGDAAARTGTLYDTRLPGNSNAGHLYGVELTPAQKKALIEFSEDAVAS